MTVLLDEEVRKLHPKNRFLDTDGDSWTLIWLNISKPEINVRSFSDIWMNLEACIQDIIEVALFSRKIWKNGRDIAEFVKMVYCRLGTGYRLLFRRRRSRRTKEEGLQITAVTTLVNPAKAEGLDSSKSRLNAKWILDLTVDAVDGRQSVYCIKGGGLFSWRRVSNPSKEYIWVVDEEQN